MIFKTIKADEIWIKLDRWVIKAKATRIKIKLADLDDIDNW
jgi:hypothetical protein